MSDAKLAKDFQSVLVEFQNAQKISQEREKMYAPFVPAAAAPTRYTIHLFCNSIHSLKYHSVTVSICWCLIHVGRSCTCSWHFAANIKWGHRYKVLLFPSGNVRGGCSYSNLAGIHVHIVFNKRLHLVLGDLYNMLECVQPKFGRFKVGARGEPGATISLCLSTAVRILI